MANQITLRPESGADSDFLFRLFASTREEEMNMVPWTLEQKNAFLRMQFQAQTTHYHQHFADAAFMVILYDTHPAGRLCVCRREQEIHVVDIALLREFRNAGIATRLLKDLLAEAETCKKRVTMYVLRNSPALRLYERLGFRVTDNGGVYLFADWRPGITTEKISGLHASANE